MNIGALRKLAVPVTLDAFFAMWEHSRGRAGELIQHYHRSREEIDALVLAAVHTR